MYSWTTLIQNHSPILYERMNEFWMYRNWRFIFGLWRYHLVCIGFHLNLNRYENKWWIQLFCLWRKWWWCAIHSSFWIGGWLKITMPFSISYEKRINRKFNLNNNNNLTIKMKISNSSNARLYSQLSIICLHKHTTVRRCSDKTPIIIIIDKLNNNFISFFDFEDFISFNCVYWIRGSCNFPLN